jgi:adenylate cyclase
LSMLSFKYIDQVVTLQSRDRAGDIRQGEALVSHALDIDPNLAQAHFAKAQLLLTQRRFDEAIGEAERVLALDPSFVGAYNTLSIGSSFLGQPDKGLAYAEKGIRLSPRDPYIYFLQFEKGFALAMLGRDSEALEWVTLAADAAPEWPVTQAVRASLLALTDHPEEAKATLERYLSLKATTAKTIEQWRSQILSASPGYVAFARRLVDGLRQAGMPDN